MAVKPIPDGYHSVTPYLILNDARAGLEYYKKAFGAHERFKMEGPGGKIMHAEISIGDSVIMLADEFPEMGANSPKTMGGTPVSILLYVENVDQRFKKAVEEGGKIKRDLQNQFYGDRSGTLEDPFGHVWTIATHVEDVAPEEMQRRSEAAMKEHCKQD